MDPLLYQKKKKMDPLPNVYRVVDQQSLSLGSIHTFFFLMSHVRHHYFF